MKKKPILQNKLFLYLTEFFSGMSLMAVELGASRLLAPYFSSSQIVWTIIIGTIMIAMALGNIYGGRAADKDPNPDKLYARVLVAAVWIALIPVVGKYIIILISGVLIFAVNSNFLVIAAFAACMVVFVFPLFLLGTVTPSLAKYTTDSLEDNGKVIGSLGAFNTIGSIIGTFMPTFVTIPAVGTSVTFLIFAGILILLSIIYFVSPAGVEHTEAANHTNDTAQNSPSTSRHIKKITASVLIFIICCIFGHSTSFAFWEDDLTYEGESVYNYLQVKETDNQVILSTNVLFGVQSILIKDGTLTGMYYDYAMAAPYMTGVKEKEQNGASCDVLILGMGSGTYATQLSRHFNNVNITGVEIDDKITDLAHKYFELPETTDVVTYDGRAYLAAIDKTYDVIMVDAYQDITIPFQMSSVEFFTMVKEHLNAGGVMVVNMNMYSDEIGSEGTINTYLADTISSVFDNVNILTVPYSTNRELFATMNSNSSAANATNEIQTNSSASNATNETQTDSSADNDPNATATSDNTSAHTNDSDIYATFARNVAMEEDQALKDLMESAGSSFVPYTSTGHVMTDDKAPVELLGMRQIDSIIQKEVTYYKKIFKEKGIKGILELL